MIEYVKTMTNNVFSDSNETCPSESGMLGEKSLEPTVSVIRQYSPHQKSPDSSPAYNGTEYHTQREHAEDFGAQDIPNKTPKQDDFKDLNGISEVDDLMLCEAANLLDSSNYFVETPKLEIEQARFLTAFPERFCYTNEWWLSSSGDTVRIYPSGIEQYHVC